jgi:hypothetical protein
MRLTILLAALVLIPLYYFACLSAGHGGPGHRHAEDRENPVWIDPHRTLYGCQHCRPPASITTGSWCWTGGTGRRWR